MIEIKDISFLEYNDLDEEIKVEYDFAIKYAKIFNSPANVFEVQDFTELSFGLVKDMQQDFQSDTSWITIFEYIEKLTGINKKEVAKKKLLTICRFVAYIVSEINRINEIEKKLISNNSN